MLTVTDQENSDAIGTNPVPHLFQGPTLRGIGLLGTLSRPSEVEVKIFIEMLAGIVQRVLSEENAETVENRLQNSLLKSDSV